MSLRRRFRSLDFSIRLKGDETQHEQTDAWSNRDLIPLPPVRRTWGWFNFFGFWSIASLNLANWQTPNTYLSKMFADLNILLPEAELHSYGLISPAGDGYHCRWQNLDRSVLDFDRLGGPEMAHRLHSAESVFVGNEG